MAERPPLPPTPTWFKVWAGFVCLLAVGLLGLFVWAVVTVVTHYAG